MTSRGIPELLNHCGPCSWGSGAGAGPGAGSLRAPPPGSQLRYKGWMRGAADSAKAATAQATACSAGSDRTDIRSVSQLGKNLLLHGFREEAGKSVKRHGAEIGNCGAVS